MFDPNEYLKMKYTPPTGTCKCENCQLVPIEQLMARQHEIEKLRVRPPVADRR